MKECAGHHTFFHIFIYLFIQLKHISCDQLSLMILSEVTNYGMHILNIYEKRI